MIEHISTLTFYILCGSFFAIIGDPNVGGTYITLLWSVTNLSSKLWEYVMIWLTGLIDGKVMNQLLCNQTEDNQ